jgi:hypothetical protein
MTITVWNDEEAKALAKRLGAVTLLDKAHLFSNLISSIKLFCDTDR